jgi:4-hydroxybenzoate polyprenyltransferase
MELDRPLGRLTRIVARIRVSDSIVFQSPAIIGMALFIPALSGANLVRTLFLAAGSFLAMAHIFAFNDWADMILDHQSAQKGHASFLERGVTRREMLYLAAVLAVAGIGAVAMASPVLVPIALGMILLGMIYSLPVRGVQAKGVPIVSSLLHFAGTVLTFLLGSAAFAAIDARSFLIGCYFGILITAGHLVQEVQDYPDDRLGGVRTNAVQFGQAPMFFLSFGLFGFSFLLLLALATAGLVPAISGYALALFPIYAYWAIGVYRGGLQYGDVKRLRDQYRILFAIVALVLVLGALAGKVL